MTTLVSGWFRLLITFLAGASSSLAWSQPCPPDRIFADGYDGVPVQRLHLVFTTQPSSASVSTVISPAVAVTVFDECNTPISGKDVQMEIGANPPNPAALGGTLTVAANAAGEADFGDLRLDYEGVDYTLLATVSGPGGTFSATSATFDETRIGDVCAGPSPACSSTCADTDGDGLNDAWEIAGGIDLNGDGLITAQYDTLLPGADVNVPDIYVQYDWMGYGLSDIQCASDAECTSQPGTGHGGETCSGPATPYSTASCANACVADADCTAIGPNHVGDTCLQGLCKHTHDPEVLAPGALQAIVDAFAAHGFNLHILRGHEVPHSHVVSFRTPEATCEGADVAPGTLGAYAVNLYDLKNANFAPANKLTSHYAVLGHLSSCDNIDHCDTRISTGTCPMVKGVRPQFGQSGQAEISGNDFVVSFGHTVTDIGVEPKPALLAGTFMHELGHNLGLHHAGGTTAPGTACTAPDCEDGPNFKPNYLSVMNYEYQTTGIVEGDAVGSNSFRTCSTDDDCSIATGARCEPYGASGICGRLDYSNDVLPTGGNTPGALTENGQLNEPAGLGSGTSDLFSFTDGQCSFVQFAATQGPVNWDGVGSPDNPNASADLDPLDQQRDCSLAPADVLRGHADWGPALGQSIFTMAFQCTPMGIADGVSPTGATTSDAGPFDEDQRVTRELTPELAAQAHTLYPPRPLGLLLPVASVATLISGPADNALTIILSGGADFDVAQVDRDSLVFHGARPVSVTKADANGDGYDDLVLTFRQADIRLSPRATRVRLTGWLANSQVFVAEAPMR